MMKNNRLVLLVSTFISLSFISCQRELDELPPNETVESSSVTQKGSYTEVLDPYTVTLIGPTQLANGNYEWIWKVQNNNPGSGNNGTFQDLSHWGFPAACLNSSTLVSAGYSSNGTSWTNFNGSVKRDPSQSCMTTPVFKFDSGTSGAAPRYFRVIVNQNYLVLPVTGYYKSGRRTGCGTFTFNGISCIAGT